MELTRQRVLVMERISGVKISDKETLLARGVNIREMAEQLNQSYLKQFFLDGFFHADPHPGNIFVRIEKDKEDIPDTGGSNGIPPSPRGTPFTIIFVDFGMMGYLPTETMKTVRGGLLGLATNDAERIVDVLFELKMFLPNVDRRPIVQAMQVLLRHTYNLTIHDLTNLDVEQIFEETRDLVYDLPFQIPQNLLYLGRALSMVTGLITDLDPEMNLFSSMRPFAHKLLEQERQNGKWLETLSQDMLELGSILLKLPRQMDAYYTAANRGELQTRTDFGRMERMLRRVEQSNERLTGGVIATGLFLGGVQLRTRGMKKEAFRAWVVAAAAIIWTMRPRGNGTPPFIPRDR
jgi:predicted unusual protein kinase regulating ubiquinone biosynthesis (AarF/ABC1/UbiB family)